MRKSPDHSTPINKVSEETLDISGKRRIKKNYLESAIMISGSCKQVHPPMKPRELVCDDKYVWSDGRMCTGQAREWIPGQVGVQRPRPFLGNTIRGQIHQL